MEFNRKGKKERKDAHYYHSGDNIHTETKIKLVTDRPAM